MSMLLSEVRAAELNERIEEIVSTGDLDRLLSEPGEVVAECARRYVAAQVKLRERASARSRESIAKFEGATAGARSKLKAKVHLIVQAVAEDAVKSEWAALLAGEFALPDGTRVSWADATAAQHEMRASQLEALAAGDMVTASIHRQAIKDLRAAGVATLGDLP